MHRDGDWHRAVNIWIVNQSGQVLLQKRSTNKDSWPNRWDISCGGHLVAGEDALTVAISELYEELGLEVQPDDLIYLSGWKSSTRPAPDFLNNSFTTLYLLRTDKRLDDFILQTSEVSELRYIDAAELKRRILEDQPDLVPHEHAYAELFRALE